MPPPHATGTARPGMESIYLKTLVEVARSGSITRAAEALAVTQSAASRRIKFMEDQYGQALLDRSGPLLKLTPAGGVVVEQALKILEIEESLRSRLHLLERKKGVSFVCTPTFGLVHLPEILRDFLLGQAEGGDLKFLLDTPEAIVGGLKGGLYEMAVVEHCQCFDLSEFETVSLASDEMVFAAAPSLGLLGPTVQLNQLFAHALYARGEGCCSRSLLENNLLRTGRRIDEFRQVVVFDDLHVIVDALVRGAGVAFISNELVRTHVEAGRLREYRVSGFQHERKRTFVHGGGFPDGSPAATFVEKLLLRVGRAEVLARPMVAGTAA